MKLYDESGYVNIEAIYDLQLPFTFIVGSRGSGKTFSSLKMLLEKKIPHILMRRKQTQVDMINRKELSPYKPVAEYLHIDYDIKPIAKGVTGFYFGTYDPDQDKMLTDNEPLGITLALSTIANIRGFSADRAQVCLLDEFIGESQETEIRNEYDCFLNMYETLNRNRELQGKPPLIVMALANSNKADNPIFVGMGLVRVLERMKKNRQEVYINRDRGIGIFLLDSSPIAELKRNTVLYRLNRDSDFNNMAINNNFGFEDLPVIRSHNLKEYKPVVNVGELAIYEHKSNGRYYVTSHFSGTVPAYSSSMTDIKRFKLYYHYLWSLYMAQMMDFEEYINLVLFERYFTM